MALAFVFEFVCGAGEEAESSVAESVAEMFFVDADVEREGSGGVRVVDDQVVDGGRATRKGAGDVVEVAEAEEADGDVFVFCGEDGICGDDGGAVAACDDDDVVWFEEFGDFLDVILERGGEDFVVGEVFWEEEFEGE